MFETNLLEFQKILNKIKDYAYFQITLENIDELCPLSNEDEVKELLLETSNFMDAIYKLGRIEFETYKVKDAINRLKAVAPLNSFEFLEIIKLVNNSDKVDSYFKKAKALEVDTEALKRLYELIVDLKDVKKEIQLVVDFDGTILDSASADLYRIRKDLKTLEGRITEKLNQIIKSDGSKLSESLITIKGCHRVLPVKSEFRNQIKGITISESSSGATAFILPFSCLEIENAINAKKEEEIKEIERILYELSVKIASHYEDINSNFEVLNYLDLVQSKALYAIDSNSTMPIISSEIDLIDARHPLIDKDKIVPNTISLKDKRTMVITGPNTGGKTVVLKTLGLLSLMAQTGILLPAKEGSKIKVFEGIYADIGDEQSIEQSLSTFSSHMTRIVKILKSVSKDSLVLLDELGSGTDPKEGASLAIAIMDTLRDTKTYTIATTHYPELKAYAYNNEDILNASVEFDVDTLKPTYRLLIGVPGRSNAFLISKRLGLSDEIIKKAQNVSLEFSDETSSLITKLENESISLNKIKEEYSKELNEAKRLNEENKLEHKNLVNKLNKQIEKLNTERNQILLKTQKEANVLLDEIKEIKRELEDRTNVKEHEIIDIKTKVNNMYQDKFIAEKSDKREIKVGDTVKVLEYDRVGVVTKIKNNKYEVSLGFLTKMFSLDEIEYQKTNNEQRKIFVKSESPKVDIKNSLDIRGERYEDALIKLDKYVDDCLINNLEFACIIHGYGTLALRNMTIDYAKTHDSVKKYRFGEESEGGNGVTVFYFK